MKPVSAAQGIHVVAKPVGPASNLNCEYCFYLEKQALFGRGGQYRMSQHVLSAFIANYVNSQPSPVVEFVWQGGEPTLLGEDFFIRVVEFQKPFARLKTIKNSLQTNGTLLTDEWCRFLKQHHFMVGISIDGPREIHDRYRRDRKGKGTFDRVIRGLRLLQAIVTGVLEIAGAIMLRKEIKGEWLLILSGIVSLVFAYMLLANPAVGALALVTLIGVYAVIFGILLMSLGARVHRLPEVKV